MPPPVHVPGRSPLQNNQPGTNTPPNMQQPTWNPGGLSPAVGWPQGVESWGDIQDQRFVAVAGNQEWVYETALFNGRPLVGAAVGAKASAYPLNHEGAYGQSFYVLIMVGGKDAASVPATVSGIRAFYTQLGNNLGTTGDNYQAIRLFTLSPEVECTEYLLAGGVSVVEPFGASLIQIIPVQPTCLYWKVRFRITVPGLAAVGPMFLQASIH